MVIRPVLKGSGVPWSVVFLIVAFAGPNAALAQVPRSSGASQAVQRIISELPAKLSWNEMIRIDARAAANPASLSQARGGRKFIPFMPGPTRREIDRSAVLSPGPDSTATLSAKGLDSEPLAIDSVEGGPDVIPLDLAQINSFQALDDNNNSIPPDTHGTAGPNHLMTMLNTQVRIQDRAGGIISTVTLGTFWSALPSFAFVFDPKVFYDHFSDRFFAVCGADADLTTSRVFFTMSDTADPTGTWSFYSFDADAANTTWADFPGVGFNTTWIAITQNMFPVGPGPFVGAKMWVIDRSTAVAGGPLTTNVFSVGFDIAAGFDGFSLEPCVTFGSEAKLYLMDNSGISGGGIPVLRMSEITGTGASPAWGATAGSTALGGSGFFFVANDFEFNYPDAPQLGTSTLIATNDIRISSSPTFRNGRIWVTHAGGLPLNIAVALRRTVAFWYELNPATMASSGAPIVQSGFLDGGSGVHHSFPSIAANANGDVSMGFSRAHSGIFIEAVTTGRLAGDAAGTMGPVEVMKAGEDSYVKTFGGSSVRWGDYSATVVDPADDLSFWSIQEYAATDVGPTASNDRWGTWWVQTQVFNDKVWVDFSYVGTETGTFDEPWNTLAEAVADVLAGGAICIKGPDTSTEAVSITKAVSIFAIGGAVSVGVP